jgi:hypothetical protein
MPSAKQDRSGPPPTPHNHPFDEATSALQKAIRRGQEDDAVYWVLQLASQFEDYCWRRLSTICTEDIGLADPDLMVRIQALRAAAKELGKDPKQRANRLSHLVLATCLLARSPKSRIVDDALTLHMAAMDDPKQRRQVPPEALDRHTQRGRQMGMGWKEFFEPGGGAHLENPAPIENPYEAAIKEHFSSANIGSSAGSVAERVRQMQIEMEEER